MHKESKDGETVLKVFLLHFSQFFIVNFLLKEKEIFNARLEEKKHFILYKFDIDIVFCIISLFVSLVYSFIFVLYFNNKKFTYIY